MEEVFHPQSGFADTGDDTKIVPDADLQTEQPAAGSPPSKESPDSIHQESAKDKKKKEVLDRKHTLSCPDPVAMPPMKAFKLPLKNLLKKFKGYKEHSLIMLRLSALQLINLTASVV